MFVSDAPDRILANSLSCWLTSYNFIDSNVYNNRKRYLRSASLSHFPTSPKSDSYGALRYRTPNIPKQRFLRSASLSHPHILKTASASPHPKSDSYGALRYRIPTS